MIRFFAGWLLIVVFAISLGAAALAETGIASWYGYTGARTANGERFDGSGMTAAHRTLPFGTKVKVTDLRTGKHVVVRINDRGPFIRGRVIDLSRHAAERLGIRVRGVAKVKLERLR